MNIGSPEPNSSSQTKNKLSSIFTSNSNSVKFSLTSTLNNLSNSQQKKSGLQRIFPFNKSSLSSNSKQQQQQNDPFASLNPFSTPPSQQQQQQQPTSASSSVSGTASSEPVDSGIDSILKKYANKSQTPASTNQNLPETPQLIGINSSFYVL